MAAGEDSSLSSVGPYLAGRVVQIDDRAIKTYLREVEQLERTGVLPNLDKKLRYNVYRGRTRTLHEAIVLKAGGRRFTIEVYGRMEGGWLYVIPKTRDVAEMDAVQMESCGTIVTTARHLIGEVAVGIFQRFGSYSLVTNNCQDFCNQFIREIGITDWAEVILGAAASAFAGLSAIAAVGLFLFMKN